MADDLGERTEEATPKRRQEAREEGNVARSQDLAGALLLLIVTVGLAVAAASVFGGFKSLVAASLDGEVLGRSVDPDGAFAAIVWVATRTAQIGLPLLVLAWGAAYAAHFWQVGWLFAPKAVQPKLSKLNPASGFKRIFGLSALVKAALDSLKVLIVVVVGVFTIIGYDKEIVTLPYLSALQAWVRIGQIMLDLALRVIAVLMVLGVLDLLYQRWKHSQDLKMTRQQVKDELKQTEGDPEVKKRRMRMQQQIAMQRISAAVPKADVVVTNPEHVSVAIQYAAESMNAPKVIAKGADFLALRIRQIAVRHQVPIVERPPLARALYRRVEVGQEIPPDFYQAVAEILAYVYRLGGRRAG